MSNDLVDNAIAVQRRMLEMIDAWMAGIDPAREKPGVVRLSPNAFVIQRSQLEDNWSPRYHDWPWQLRILRAHLRELREPLRIWQEIRRLRHQGWLMCRTQTRVGGPSNPASRKSHFAHASIWRDVVATKRHQDPEGSRLNFDTPKQKVQFHPAVVVMACRALGIPVTGSRLVRDTWRNKLHAYVRRQRSAAQDS